MPGFGYFAYLGRVAKLETILLIFISYFLFSTWIGSANAHLTICGSKSKVCHGSAKTHLLICGSTYLDVGDLVVEWKTNCVKNQYPTLAR